MTTDMEPDILTAYRVKAINSVDVGAWSNCLRVRTGRVSVMEQSDGD